MESITTSHALVVGGTGMLRDVSRHLTQHYSTVTVIGRNSKRMNQFLDECAPTKGKYNPLVTDYRDLTSLSEKLETSIDMHGEISLAVCWIHSVGKDALPVIAEILNHQSEASCLIHILGSATADPSKTYLQLADQFKVYINIEYLQVVLGFKLENGQSRWLTDQEICDGVTAVIKTKEMFTIVGTTTPWSSRP